MITSRCRSVQVSADSSFLFFLFEVLFGGRCWYGRGLGRVSPGVVLARSRIRKKRPRNSSPGGRWASCSGLAILDLDLHLDPPQFDIHLAIILSSILTTSKHVHPGPHTRTDLAMSTELRQLSRYLYHSSVLTVARTRWGEERKYPCQQDRRKILRVERGEDEVDVP